VSSISEGNHDGGGVFVLDDDEEISPHAKGRVDGDDGSSVTSAATAKQQDLPSPGEEEDFHHRRRLRKIRQN
jgi:hypothetical protein